MPTEYARERWIVTGHNEPGMAGEVEHLIEPDGASGNGPPRPDPRGGRPRIVTASGVDELPRGTVIETVATWSVVT